MFEQLSAIVAFVIDAFLHLWPYLLVTIPLAVAVNMSGASRYINRAFQARPLVSVFLATAVGAFSPFCSCGVIPVIAALLMSGVPLAPVMSFWIASPSMDPEAFFLSVSTIGWELAVWRLAGTLALSLGAGLVTQLIVARGWLGQPLLRQRGAPRVQTTWALLKAGWHRLVARLTRVTALRPLANPPAFGRAICCSAAASVPAGLPVGRVTTPAPTCGTAPDVSAGDNPGPAPRSSCQTETKSFRLRLLQETWGATLMVAKFMALAFVLEALITLYVPEAWIAGLLGRQNPLAIPAAAFLGVPVYTSNMAALPMVSGLLAQGMNPAAALAFLIAGPTTTLPAMAAVWGLTSRRVFALYVSFALLGAVLLGYLYSLAA